MAYLNTDLEEQYLKGDLSHLNYVDYAHKINL